MVSTSPDIIRRRIDIDFSLEGKHRWTSEAAYFEDILNVVSYFFPIGEKYFITSVQNYEDQITDPVLKQNVKDFIYQEAMHTKQHVRSNVVLDSIHSYGPAIEKISDFFLVKTRWLTPKATQLAITCALEHFTALLADYLLRTLEGFNSESNESFGPLWAWHAVEETEHKGVCFDVYQNIFGNGGDQLSSSSFRYDDRQPLLSDSCLCWLVHDSKRTATSSENAGCGKATFIRGTSPAQSQKTLSSSLEVD